jgi:hypothetical protein
MGNHHDFSWYFEGESAVKVETLDDVLEWLLGCGYVRDPELFHEQDFWQHPRTFERLRQGDCEDHAMWAWRKLIELGYDADLVSGRLTGLDATSAGSGGHVWVLFRRNGETFILEATAKAKEQMLRTLVQARAEYIPSVGVDRTRKRFAYNGLLLTLKDRQPPRPSRRTA